MLIDLYILSGFAITESRVEPRWLESRKTCENRAEMVGSWIARCSVEIEAKIAQHVLEKKNLVGYRDNVAATDFLAHLKQWQLKPPANSIRWKISGLFHWCGGLNLLSVNQLSAGTSFCSNNMTSICCEFVVCNLLNNKSTTSRCVVQIERLQQIRNNMRCWI